MSYNRYFYETGNNITRNRPLAGCEQMITCNTDGAVVVVRRILMLVRYYRKSRHKKKQNEKNSNWFVPDHKSPFTQ